MDSPSPPAAPDPVVTANAQGAANENAARVTAALNRVNQYTPYGSLTWSQGTPKRTFNQERYDKALAAAQGGTAGAPGPVDWNSTTWTPQQYSEALRSGRSIPSGITIQEASPGGGMVGGGLGGWASGGGGGGPLPNRDDDQFYDYGPSDQWSSTVNLDPRVQQLVDAQIATSQGLQGSTDAALQRVNQTMGQAAPTPDAEMRKRVEDALYGRYTSRLDPQYAQQENSIRTNLMNRGMVEGSEGWKTQLDTFGREKNDAYALAMQNAVAGGGSEMARQYEMEMAGRNAVLNELNALRSGQQVQTPTFGQTPSGATVNPAPIAQSMFNKYQGDMGIYNADVASNNNMMSGAASIAAAAIAAF